MRFGTYIVLILVAVAGWLAVRKPVPHERGPLRQEAYVWQRAWTPAVTDAIRERAGDFAALPVLAAEVKWEEGRPLLTRVPIDFALLKSIAGLAYPVIRVGAYSGSFDPNAPAARYLAALCRSILDEWSAKEIVPAELQWDFDCPESKLSGYRTWIQMLRRETTPVRFTITALPAWLGNPQFKSLAAASGGFVLQVHSFRPPKVSSEPYVLCDPVKASKFIEIAAGMGVPFRVALPTYGYRLIFDETGKLQGLAAEGSAKDWPEGRLAREVRANPNELAGLVQQLMNGRPGALKGIIWYRLPNRADDLNWPWATLQSVMAGKVPDARLAITSTTSSHGLTELTMANAGSAMVMPPPTIRLSWLRARLIAGDGLAGYELVDAGDDGAVLKRSAATRSLDPGAHASAGWLRLSEPTEVQIDF